MIVSSRLWLPLAALVALSAVALYIGYLKVRLADSEALVAESKAEITLLEREIGEQNQKIRAHQEESERIRAYSAELARELQLKNRSLIEAADRLEAEPVPTDAGCSTAISRIKEDLL